MSLGDSNASLCVKDASQDGTPTGTAGGSGGSAANVKKQFYANIDLDLIQAKRQFANLVDKVVEQFTQRSGIKVKIAIEIQAESPAGFDDSLQRAVKESCNALRFKSAEFETGE